VRRRRCLPRIGRGDRSSSTRPHRDEIDAAGAAFTASPKRVDGPADIRASRGDPE